MGRLAIGLALVAVAVLVAGCLGAGNEDPTRDEQLEPADAEEQPDGEEDDQAEEDESSEEDQEQTPENATASDETGSDSSPRNETGTVVETHEVEATGSIGPGGQVASYGPRAFLPTENEERWHFFDLEGTVTAVELTMDWEASNPSVSTLEVIVGEREDTDQGWTAPTTEKARGEAPLEISLSELSWSKGTYVIYAWWDRDQPAQVALQEQSLTWEGTVTYETQS